MKRVACSPAQALLTVFCVCLPLFVRAQAAGEAEDVENARTPKSVLELLPEDDGDLPRAFWAIEEYTVGGTVYPSYFFWSMKRTEDGIVFETRTGDKQGHTRDKLAYSARGRLRSYQYIAWAGDKRSTLTGFTRGEQWLVSEASMEPGAEAVGARRPVSYPLKDTAARLPMHWAPVVAAYHVRQLSLGYQWNWSRLSSGKLMSHMEFAVEAVGKEAVEHQGKEQQAQVLIVHAGRPGTDFKDEANRHASRVTILIMPTGELHSVAGVLRGGEYKYSAHHADAAQVAERFGLDLQAMPDLPELPEAE